MCRAEAGHGHLWGSDGVPHSRAGLHPLWPQLHRHLLPVCHPSPRSPVSGYRGKRTPPSPPPLSSPLPILLPFCSYRLMGTELLNVWCLALPSAWLVSSLFDTLHGRNPSTGRPSGVSSSALNEMLFGSTALHHFLVTKQCWWVGGGGGGGGAYCIACLLHPSLLRCNGRLPLAGILEQHRTLGKNETSNKNGPHFGIGLCINVVQGSVIIVLEANMSMLLALQAIVIRL